MNFISYAQNYEDVMLWRVLKHIEKGFYIDIGAWSPEEHSVTKSFYESGWRGINIEPNPDYFGLYEKKRKEDVNLCVAVSDMEGEAEMYFVSNPGLSSLDKSIAEGHSSLGWVATPANVKVRTLEGVCEEYCLEEDIHFLKIDVEGFEEQVLRGNDWSRFRPWVVVVEATLPMSQIESYEDWEPILFDANYRLAYMDGLNRFYVAKEHEELLPAFKYPPNVFDEFRLISEIQAEAKATQAEANAAEAEAKAAEAEAKAAEAEVKAAEAEAKAAQAEATAIQAEAKAGQLSMELSSVYNSHSWRITEPLRLGNAFIRKFKASFFKPYFKRLLQQVFLFFSRHPKLKKTATVVLGHMPYFRERLRSVFYGSNDEFSKQFKNTPIELANLTPHARNIYANLKTALDGRQKEG